MAFNERLEHRTLSTIDRWNSVSTKKMFGGVCHLIHGNMFCGFTKDFLILRLGETAAAAALSKAHTHPFDITGRPMKGWVMVEPDGVETDEAVTRWLQKARDFAQTLPPK